MASHRAIGVPTEVLIAPDSFKGTFSARAVAAALQRGLAASGQPAQVCPVADGGEGTLDALAGPLEVATLSTSVSDPLGREVRASFGLAPGAVAVVELAAASGLTLVAEDQRDAVAASSYGTGELIAAALEAGAETVYVAAGGSATTDGGEGALRALADRGVAQARLTVLCDVRTPFESAAATFAPQKGASPDQVRTLERRLDRLATSFSRDPRGVAMTGAAGGLAGGLWAQFGAELVSGAAFVLSAVDYDTRMRAARAVVTGEGRLDRQSLVGKIVSEVATRARQAGVPCHAVVGANALELFDLRILDLQLVLEASTFAELEEAGAELGAALQAETGTG